MNEIIKSYKEKIIENYNDLMDSIKTSVNKAYSIGELLFNKKQECQSTNEFIIWVNSELPFGITTADKWIKMFVYKISQVENLQEAYKKIEQIEYKEKQIEKQKKQEMIEEYKNTGKKPNGWNRSIDYEYEKEIRFQETLKKIEEENKKKEKLGEGKKTNNINNILEEFKNNEKEKNELRKDLKMTFRKHTEIIYDEIDNYLLKLDNNSLKLETLNNIIKYCKRLAINFQKG